MPINFPKDGTPNNATESLRKALFGERLEYGFKSHRLNREGKAKGVITGGNLSMLYSIKGTNSDIDTRGKVLFLEDLDEYLYHVDRMMWNLKKGGKLENLNALIIGGMTNMNDNTVPFGKTAEEIISEAVKDFEFPVCFNFPAGHIAENCAIILGREVQLKVENNPVVRFAEK